MSESFDASDLDVGAIRFVDIGTNVIVEPGAGRLVALDLAGGGGTVWGLLVGPNEEAAPGGPLDEEDEDVELTVVRPELGEPGGMANIAQVARGLDEGD